MLFVSPERSRGPFSPKSNGCGISQHGNMWRPSDVSLRLVRQIEMGREDLFSDVEGINAEAENAQPPPQQQVLR